MLERLLIAAVLLAAGYVAYRVWIARQKGTVNALVPVDPLLTNVAPGVPVIVYFTTPNCAPCRLQRRKALCDRRLGHRGAADRADGARYQAGR